MARRKRHNWNGESYLTLGPHVYLGRVSAKVRNNALRAGLIPITKAQCGKMMRNMQAIQRISCEGLWYDTVRYT